MSIFAKLTNAQQRYELGNPYNEFHPNMTIGEENTDKLSETSLSLRRFAQNLKSLNHLL